jgi:hypothetical protein
MPMSRLEVALDITVAEAALQMDWEVRDRLGFMGAQMAKQLGHPMAAPAVVE